MALVEIRPLDIPRWHGKQGKEAFTQPHTIEALYDHSTGGYATGLSEKEEIEYSKKMGGVDLSNHFNQDAPHPFWGSKMGRIKLENATMILDDTIALEFVKIKVLKASKFVANSLKDWENGLYPEATHVIYDESEEVGIKATKIQKKKKAVKLSYELDKASQANIVQILTGKSVRNRSQDFIDIEIDEFINERTDEFLVQAQMDKKDLSIRAAVLEAIFRNILTKEGTSIFYLSDKIGFDFESTIEWFKDPQNQNMKVSILDKLNK